MKFLVRIRKEDENLIFIRRDSIFNSSEKNEQILKIIKKERKYLV